jgi:hypothetical protein
MSESQFFTNDFNYAGEVKLGLSFLISSNNLISISLLNYSTVIGGNSTLFNLVLIFGNFFTYA